MLISGPEFAAQTVQLAELVVRHVPRGEVSGAQALFRQVGGG